MSEKTTSANNAQLKVTHITENINVRNVVVVLYITALLLKTSAVMIASNAQQKVTLITESINVRRRIVIANALQMKIKQMKKNAIFVINAPTVQIARKTARKNINARQIKNACAKNKDMMTGIKSMVAARYARKLNIHMLLTKQVIMV